MVAQCALLEPGTAVEKFRHESDAESTASVFSVCGEESKGKTATASVSSEASEPKNELRERERRELAAKVAASLRLYARRFSPSECDVIEAWLNELGRRAEAGLFECAHTVDVTPARTKYFFGNGYTYGQGRQGREELLPLGSVDPIPVWLYSLVVAPLVAKGVIREGWVDSVVINDYGPGGSIVSHVDPPHLFDRPIFTATFFCPAKLSFGASFDPQRTVPPLYSQLLPRGSVLMLGGASADDVTHGMRPEDMLGSRRVSIVMRHVREGAPVFGGAQPLSDGDRSWLIRELQGRWCDPTGQTTYIVQQLRVSVIFTAKRGWPQGDEEGGVKVATWRLDPRESGLVCNTGILEPSGVSPGEISWRTLHAKTKTDAFRWIRLED